MVLVTGFNNAGLVNLFSVSVILLGYMAGCNCELWHCLQ